VKLIFIFGEDIKIAVEILKVEGGIDDFKEYPIANEKESSETMFYSLDDLETVGFLRTVVENKHALVPFFS